MPVFYGIPSKELQCTLSGKKLKHLLFCVLFSSALQKLHGDIIDFFTLY